MILEGTSCLRGASRSPEDTSFLQQTGLTFPSEEDPRTGSFLPATFLGVPVSLKVNVQRRKAFPHANDMRSLGETSESILTSEDPSH